MLRISHQSFTFRLTFPLLLAAFPEAGVLNVKNQSSVVYFSFDVPPFCLQLSQKDEATQAAHLQSSNLSHFAAVVHAATCLPGVTRVLRSFTAPDRQHNLLVDVVADQGRSWVKVVARKGQALHLVWAGKHCPFGNSYGRVIIVLVATRVGR